MVQKFEASCLTVIFDLFFSSSNNVIFSETPCSIAFCDDQWWPCILDMYEWHPWSRQQGMVSTYMAKTLKTFIWHYISIIFSCCYWANAMKLLSVKSALHNAAYANCKPSQSPRLFCGSRSYLILAFGTFHTNRFRAEYGIYNHLFYYKWLHSSSSIMRWSWIVCGRCKSSLGFILRLGKNIIFCICKPNKFYSISSPHLQLLN